jgi:hypothetical protein
MSQIGDFMIVFTPSAFRFRLVPRQLIMAACVGHSKLCRHPTRLAEGGERLRRLMWREDETGGRLIRMLEQPISLLRFGASG